MPPTWMPQLRTFFGSRRSGPGLIALAIVGVLNWIVSDALNFTAIVSELNLDVPAFRQVAGVLLPEFGLFGVLFVGAVICWLFDWDRLTRFVFFTANSIAMFNVTNYAFDLLFSITKRGGNRDAALLLVDAVLVWLMNWIVFTIWFWILDAGGPERRGTTHAKRIEMQFKQQEEPIPGWEHWRPGFLDYLFAAFGSSTSLGPNDVSILSRRFKVLSMVQTLNSLTVVALIAARAIGLFTVSR
ncbi:MAG: hypothetical protein U0559_10065 [Anaerolineae bacterium]